MEIEKKFIIQKPNRHQLEKVEGCHRVDILQTYLVSSTPSVERRVRRVIDQSKVTYYYTTKSDISTGIRDEREVEISGEEYTSKLVEADFTKHQIRKNRYLIPFRGKTLEIDIYPFWGDKAVLEIELSDPDEKVYIPDYIKVVENVTGNKLYSNGGLASTPNLYGDDTPATSGLRTKFRVEAKLLDRPKGKAEGYLVKNLTNHPLIFEDWAIGVGMVFPVYLVDLAIMGSNQLCHMTFSNAKIVASSHNYKKHIIRLDKKYRVAEYTM